MTAAIFPIVCGDIDESRPNRSKVEKKVCKKKGKYKKNNSQKCKSREENIILKKKTKQNKNQKTFIFV